MQNPNIEKSLETVTLKVEGKTLTLRQYLYTLLSNLWEQAEDFNGKRPFGYGSWQFDIYRELISQGYIDGKLDKDGYVVSFNEKEGNDFMQQVISHVFFNH